MAGFDPTHAVTFDLAHGTVTAGDQRHVLLSSAVVDDFVLIAGPEAAAAVGRAFGMVMGRRLAVRRGGTLGVRAASVDEVVTDIAGELAVAGLGAAALERWGRALVVVIDRPAVSDLPFLASIVEGMIDAATGSMALCTSLGRDGTLARFLIAGARSTGRAREMLAQGSAWGEVVARLQAQAGRAT
jgi:hypothetical protein